MKYIKIITYIFVSAVVTSPLHAQYKETRMYKDAASMGMGGVGVSTIGYSFSPIYNPAALGLMANYDIAPFLSLGMSINPHTISVLKNISGNSDSIYNMDYNQLINTAPSIGINGPLALGYMGKGFGFWTTSSSDVSVAITENKNNLFSANNINVNWNHLVAASLEFSTLQEQNFPLTEDKVIDIFNKHLGNDLNDEQIRKIAKEISENPDMIKTFIPQAKVAGTTEITVNMGYGYKIPFKTIDQVSGISFGATVRFSQRFKFDSGTIQPIDQLATQFNDITSKIYQAGSISSDFGMALQIQNWILGVSVLDALSTKYQWKNLDGLQGGLENSQIPWSLNAGTSYRFLWDNKFVQQLGLYVEFIDIMNDFIPLSHKVRLGTELQLFNFLHLRVGMYQSFVTSGIGMSWKWFKMDFAYYRENYYNLFENDQFYFNMTVGLDNSQQRKNQSIKKQLSQDQIQSKALNLINNSLDGVESL